MLYYHLLLARLEARDDLGRATSAMIAPTSSPRGVVITSEPAQDVGSKEIE
jgi:hypothetical protein